MHTKIAMSVFNESIKNRKERINFHSSSRVL